MISVREYTQKGIFFRNPFFRREYDLWSGSHKGGLNDSKSLLGIVHRILNSPKKLNDLREFIKEDDAAGYFLNSVRSPIYFEREVKELHLEVSFISKQNNPIRMIIKSKGFNYIDEPVGGYCAKERTKITVETLYTTITKKFTDKGKYNFTYEHVAKNTVERYAAGGKLNLNGEPWYSDTDGVEIDYTS